MTPIVVHVTRRYRGMTALDDVSTALQTDTITGLLGRNGAGKSTLMRIIAGQEFVSSGTVRVGAESPGERLGPRPDDLREGKARSTRTSETVLLITWRQWWPQVGPFLGDPDIVSASGLIAVVAVVVALGGYGTIRRITVGTAR